MHPPSWFRIGGIPLDLPDGWEQKVAAFTHDFSKRIDELDQMLTDGPIFRVRTEGVGTVSLDDALDWGGFSGPNLRACGLIGIYVAACPIAATIILILMW